MSEEIYHCTMCGNERAFESQICGRCPRQMAALLRGDYKYDYASALLDELNVVIINGHEFVLIM